MTKPEGNSLPPGVPLELAMSALGLTGGTACLWRFEALTGHFPTRQQSGGHRAALGPGGRPEMNFTRYRFQTAA
jgi:hypothetical protein